uniref:Uncharacterized protein n=1 Tax=Setaria italica TaxID=4555 RepID=K3ZKH0_SETIT
MAVVYRGDHELHVLCPDARHHGDMHAPCKMQNRNRRREYDQPINLLQHRSIGGHMHGFLLPWSMCSLAWVRLRRGLRAMSADREPPMMRWWRQGPLGSGVSWC